MRRAARGAAHGDGAPIREALAHARHRARAGAGALQEAAVPPQHLLARVPAGLAASFGASRAGQHAVQQGCCSEQRHHHRGHKRECSHIHHLICIGSQSSHTGHHDEGECKAKPCAQQQDGTWH